MNKGSDEHPTVKLVVGNYYTIKGNVFNKGAYQPVSPVRLDSLWVDGFTGIHWAYIFAAQANPQGDKIRWQIPQSDLK